MITKNTNGQNLSAGFIAALTAENRVYDAKILLNGTALDCSVNSITITKGSCGSDTAFTVGNVVGSALTANVTGLATAIKGKEIEVHIGLEVDGAFEYVSLGKFVVSEAPQNIYTTNITAYGTVITRTGAAFDPPQTKTLVNIAASIASTVSALAGRTVTVTFGSGITTSKTITADLNNLTVYQTLQILAGAVGGYAVDTYDGNIKIYRFDDTPTLTRTTDTMVNLPVVEETDFEVSGVVCVVTQATETAPAVQYPANPTGLENLIIENQYITEDLYTSYLSALTGYKYRPANIGLTYGDPRLEGNDVIQVTDINDVVYIIPCHMLTHTYTGGFATQVVSVTATEQENDVASSAGNLTQQLSQIGASAISAKASAETAKAAAAIADGKAVQAAQAAAIALSSATAAGQAADAAQESADEAMGSAIAANIASNSALTQLSVVEDVAAVLTWISEHGTYKLTDDTAVVSGKLYFTKTGDEYNLVTTPTGNPHTQSYYEIDTIGDEAVSNYISSHLSLTNAGLWVVNDSSSYKILLASDGMKVYDASGNLVSTFGESITYSSTRAQYIGNNNAYIVFDPDDNGSITIGGSNILLGTDKPLSEVLAELDGTLIFDTSYVWNNAHTVATFTAHVYRGGVDIAQTDFESTDFTWYLKTEDGEVPIVPSGRQDNTGYTTTVNMSDCGYGAEVVAKFTTPENATALTNDGDTLTDADDEALTVRASGDSVRVRDLTVSTTLYSTDKLMVVGGENEHLVTTETMADALWDYFDVSIENLPLQQGNNNYDDIGLLSLTNIEIDAMLA